MPFQLDPEIAAGIQKIMGSGPPPAPLLRGDYKARRHMVDTVFGGLIPPMSDNVSTTDYHTTADDGHKILVRWYTKKGTTLTNSPAVVYYHGGGFIAGSVTMYDGAIAQYVGETGVPFLNVEFRAAPEAQYPVNVKDGYAGLKWLFDHAAELGVDPARIAVMGDSGGGGITAAVTHWNLEKGDKLPIVKQILIYPMLDDRSTEKDTQIGAFAIWTEVDNATGWECVLGDLFQKDGVPPSAAPGRMTTADGLPPAYIETGELDIFRNDIMLYAAKFGLAGISMELHVHPGCPHAFELFAPESDVVKRAYADRARVLRNL